MPTPTPQPAFVLIRPQMGENIGAAARAMWNFGLDRMRVIAPRDGWPNERAVAMASGAGRLLDEAQIFPATADALDDCTHVYATTARPRGLVKPVMSPEAAMRDAAARIARGEKVAVMFGPERAGMENDDIARANTIVTVPVNPEFASLNLGQCVLLMAYEWQRATAEIAHERVELAGAEWANGKDVEALAQHFETELDKAGFYFPEEKAPHMKMMMRNMWSRMPFTKGDVATLHGALRQILRGKINN